MSKVIKILVTTLTTLILTGLGLVLAVTLLLEMPSVQNFIVHKATRVLSEKLGTRVSIDRVRLKLISRAELEGVYVEDLHGDTLAYIRRLQAGIRDLGLSGGPVMLGAIELDGTRFYMHQVRMSNPDTLTSTLGEILWKLKSNKPKKKGGGFELRAASIKITDLAYRYRKITPDKREYGVNFQDVDVTGLNLDADEISVINDSITMRANHISIRDKSGFSVDDMSATHLSVSNKGLRFERLHILTPDSRVDMNYLNLISDSWKSFGYFVDSVRMEADLNASKMSYATVAWFAPGLRDWKSVYDEITGTIEGTVADMRGEIRRFRTLDTSLDGLKFAIKGLPDVPRTDFNFEVGQLRTSADDALWLMRDITRKELPANTAQMLSRLGEISFSGHFAGLLDRFKAQGDLETSRGGAKVDVAFTPQTGGLTAFDGHLDVAAFDIGALLDSKSLGRASVAGQVEGTMGGKSISLDADVAVSRLDFNGYSYHGIDMRGKFENRNFQGDIACDDPNISFDFDGELDFNDSLPRYDFLLRLRNADLHKLNLNKRDSLSVLSGVITAKATGNAADNVNGHVDIDSLVYLSPYDTIRADRIRLTGVNTATTKLLALQSSFADVQFSSRLGYANLGQYLTEAIQTYIPTLNTDRSRRKQRTVAAANPGDYYLLKLKVKEANNLSRAIVPGLILAQGTELSFMLNPVSQNVSLTLQSDYIEYNRFFTSNISLTGRNQGDSLSLFVRATDFYASGFYMPDFSVIGGGKDDRVSLAARFDDKEHRVSAIVNSTAQFDQTASGLQQIRMRLGQSYITNKDQTWRLSSGDVVYDTTRVSVDRLRIVSSNGELTAQGVLSRLPSDTIHVRLSNFNLQPFTQFSERRGYSISGLTNGYADMAAAMGKGILSSDIRFDSLKVNNVPVVPLLFNARWDFQNERARVALTNRAAGDTLVRFFYRPTDKQYLGFVKMRGVDLSLIDPVLSGVIKNTTGRADLDLRVTSREGEPLINGTVKIPALTTTVAFTNVPYTLKDAQITAKDNTFRLPTTQLTDPGGGSADFDASFVLAQGFSNYTYTLGVKPRNLLALSTTPADNELFNGKVYATGAVTIKGDKKGVAMNIAATTAANSSFQMSLSSKSGIGDADFITFVNPNKVTSDSTWYQKRKQQIIAAGNSKKRSDNASGLAIDMALTVLPNTDFSLVIDPTMGKGIRARGNGVLNISVDPRNGDFRMYGDYELTDGSYNLNLERLVNKTFTILPGSSIKWAGDPVDAMLNVTAGYKLQPSMNPLVTSDSPLYNTRVNTECKIILTDHLLPRPNINFQVDVTDATPETQSVVASSLNTPEQMSTQFLYLVAFGRFYSDASGSGGMGTMASGAAALDLLLGQFNNAISSDKYNIGLKYNPGDETTSQEFGIDFSTSLWGERIFLDMEGNYDTESNPSAAAGSGGLTGDFAVRYLIDRTGNFQGKIFSRTINTYDENQGMQETGLGIYYHEDFNTVGDISRNIRARFRKKSDTTSTAEPVKEPKKKRKDKTKNNN